VPEPRSLFPIFTCFGILLLFRKARFRSSKCL
jgi:hypothetical protein